jgi:GntR family transcriptional regulator
MGKTPKYQQVVDWVHERILSGELKMDDRLETEAEISTRFDFSRQTIRQALSSWREKESSTESREVEAM